MAAVSVPHVSSALTPPSSSHGGQSSWNFSVPSHSQNSLQSSKLQQNSGFPSTNDQQISQVNSSSLGRQSSRSELSQRRADNNNPAISSKTSQSLDPAYLVPSRLSALNRKDSSISDTGSAPDSLLDLYGSSSANRSGINSMDFGDRKDLSNGDAYQNEEDPEHSRWIHRDKLARIESQELQAAGFILPRARAHSKSTRPERSRDPLNNGSGKPELSTPPQTIPRLGSLPTEGADYEQDNGWDLRLPEEVARDNAGRSRDHGSGSKGLSRIPLYTTSPLPVPLDYLERDTPMQRTRSNGWTGDDEAMSYPKSRSQSQGSINMLEDAMASPTPAKRAASESSPTKKTTAPALRKASAPSKPPASTRPKTRSGTNRDTANQRPTTRSGELGPSNSVKKPEGDPPWLTSMYKPDPRLPPDQQLLPTVAKRLQQEQWEKEGKFGNAYDKDFRPLNDEEFQPKPESMNLQVLDVPEQKPENQAEWPLKMPKSPALSTGRPGTAGGGYSTMPKITSTPHQGTPLQSPRVPSTQQPFRLQEPPEETKKGCGCCVVM